MKNHFPRLRSFLAIDPSLEVLSKIVETVKMLEPRTRGFRWVRPEGIHLTLKFLGEVKEEVLKTIEGRVTQLVADEGPISLTAAGIGFFPNPVQPRIVWAGLQGETERLKSLTERLEEIVQDLPVHQEEKKSFTPHITIARIRDSRKCSGIAHILQIAKSVAFGSFSVDSLILYKSSLTPQGARYTRLREFESGGK